MHGLPAFTHLVQGRNSVHLFRYTVQDTHGLKFFALAADRLAFSSCFVDSGSGCKKKPGILFNEKNSFRENFIFNMVIWG
jgi:hypothetical protein